MAEDKALEDIVVKALVIVQRVGLWLIVIVPYSLGIVGGAAVRLGRLLWAAMVEGYRTGVGNA